MLEVAALDDVGTALDIVNERQIPLAMSLGRHTNDLMTSFYVRTPSGFEIEYGTGGLARRRRHVEDRRTTTRRASGATSLRPTDRCSRRSSRPFAASRQPARADSRRLSRHVADASIAAELADARAEGDELRRLPDDVWKQLLEGGIPALRCSRRAGAAARSTSCEFVDAVMAICRAPTRRPDGSPA